MSEFIPGEHIYHEMKEGRKENEWRTKGSKAIAKEKVEEERRGEENIAAAAAAPQNIRQQ